MLELAERGSEAFPCVVDVSLGGLAHEMFEIGENLFGRVEVRALGWQKEVRSLERRNAERKTRPSSTQANQTRLHAGVMNRSG
jgi:hypothetical protein